MVVEYASGSYWWSYFYNTPQIIFFHWSGSVIPNVAAQVVIAVGIAIISRFWNPVEAVDVTQGFAVVGFLLSFLLVFKTQTSYNQFWSALSLVDDVIRLSTHLAMNACTMCPSDRNSCYGNPCASSVVEMVRPAGRCAQRVIRLIALHWLVVIEYFSRTGSNSTRNTALKNKHRKDIRLLTRPDEYKALYDEDVDDQITGADSKTVVANPAVVLYWIQTTLCHAEPAAPVMSNFGNQVSAIASAFWAMNKLDKTQFPLPYAQIVKIVCSFFVFLLPFVLRPSCKDFTEIVIAIIAMGFFGLDEVAEMLESPFGVDANSVELRLYTKDFLLDLDMLYKGRNTRFDEHFAKVQHSFRDSTHVADNEGEYDELMNTFSRNFHEAGRDDTRSIPDSKPTLDAVIDESSGRQVAAV